MPGRRSRPPARGIIGRLRGGARGVLDHQMVHVLGCDGVMIPGVMMLWCDRSMTYWKIYPGYFQGTTKQYPTAPRPPCPDGGGGTRPGNAPITRV